MLGGDSMNLFVGKNSGANHFLTSFNRPLENGENGVNEKKNVFHYPAMDVDRKETNAKDKKTLLQRRAE